MVINYLLYIGVILMSVNIAIGSSLFVTTQEVNDAIKKSIIAEKNSVEIIKNNTTDFNEMPRNETEKEANHTEHKNLTLSDLEKEKINLYEEIIKSIDDSVLLLENTNDTEAKLGIDFMKDLKYQLNKINGTDSTLPKKDDEITHRRYGSEKKIKLTYEEIANLFKKRNKSGLFLSKGVSQKDMELKNRIDDWILQKQLEKQQILDYQNKMNSRLMLEKCYRYGEDKKKKIKVNGKYRKRYRPCCRKCCKKSYMGCL